MRKLLILSLGVAFLNCVSSAQVYQATFLKSDRYYTTNASGINDAGTIAGTCRFVFNPYHACYWTSSGGLTDLGTLGGMYSSARAVNNLGQIVGYSSDASNGQRAFLWTPTGGMQALPTLGSDPDDLANAINKSGEVVGVSRLTPEGPFHAFFWSSSGGIRDLGTLPGDNDSDASGINSTNHVVGSSSDLNDGVRAFMWTQAGGMQELAPTSGLLHYRALAINDKNEVVGEFLNPADNKQHAFLWTQSGGIQDLGVLAGDSSSAVAIDKTGQLIVGRGTGSSPSSGYGLLWRSGEIFKLDALAGGIHLGGGAVGINSSGEIIANQGSNGVLLRPSWVKLSSRSINFGSVAVGQTSSTRNLIITNIATTPLTISGASLAGASPEEYSLTNACPSTLAAGGRCFIRVTFTPTASRQWNATINLSDSDPTSPQQVSVTGIGN